MRNMDKIKIISSLNTRPLIEGRWNNGNKFDETMYMTALSLMYSNLWYDEIEFFTDKVGYEIFKDLPINISILKNKSHKDMWASCKFEAISCQKKQFIHIDTDVFLQKQLVFDKSTKVIVERKELGVFEKHYKPQVDWFSNLLKKNRYWKSDIDFSLNCGTIGFFDMKLKNQFIKQYKLVEKTYIDNIQKFKYLKDKWFEPCIVVEQYNLNSFLHVKKIKPKYVLNTDTLKEQSDEAKIVGYTHLFGQAKYTRENKFIIKERLLNLFPETFYDIKSKLEIFNSN